MFHTYLRLPFKILILMTRAQFFERNLVIYIGVFGVKPWNSPKKIKVPIDGSKSQNYGDFDFFGEFSNITPKTPMYNMTNFVQMAVLKKHAIPEKFQKK